EGVCAGSDRLVGPTLPIGEVVPALMPRPGPVGDLVPTIAGAVQGDGGVVILLRRAVLVLRRDGLVAPAPGAAGRRQVVAPRAGQALGHRVVEGQRVQRQVIRVEIQ